MLPHGVLHAHAVQASQAADGTMRKCKLSQGLGLAGPKNIKIPGLRNTNVKQAVGKGQTGDLT
jgi:hypothetical protein